MERLTRKETVIARGVETVACNYENGDCDDRCRYGTCRWQNKANMRLKEYEDTGLTPPEIMKLKERDRAKAPVQTEDGMVCPTCGSKALPWSRFCDECGQRWFDDYPKMEGED